MRFWKRKQDKIAGQTKRRRRFALAYCPDDVTGWLRIPSMIAGIAGIVGVVKYSSLPAAAYLKSVNLPAVEFCWLMLGAGCSVYVLSLACWLFVEDAPGACRPQGNTTGNSGQWRSL